MGAGLRNCGSTIPESSGTGKGLMTSIVLPTTSHGAPDAKAHNSSDIPETSSGVRSTTTYSLRINSCFINVLDLHM